MHTSMHVAWRQINKMSQGETDRSMMIYEKVWFDQITILYVFEQIELCAISVDQDQMP